MLAHQNRDRIDFFAGRAAGHPHANRVGRTADVRSIVLTGGGAALYEASIRAAFPRVQLDVLDAPCYANAKGFLIVGEATLARERKPVGVAA